MKRFIVGLASVIMMVAMVMPAQARTIVRDGSDYNGYANPGECEIFVHDNRPTQLHVDCKASEDKGARIRWRFLRDLGGKFEPADVSVDLKINGGDCTRSDVRWMVPVPRTVRVVVEAGCYVHIRSITWTQA